MKKIHKECIKNTTIITLSGKAGNKNRYKGVYNYSGGRFRSQVQYNNRTYCLGVFDSAADAGCAYIIATALASSGALPGVFSQKPTNVSSQKIMEFWRRVALEYGIT